MRNRGLTLAETLVALTLLSLLMVAVLNIFPTTMMIVRGTRTGWLARSAAQNEVEGLAAQPFASLQVGYAKDADVVLSDGSKVKLRTEVGAVDGHPVTSLKRISCEARWKGRAVEQTSKQELYVHSLRR